MSSLQRVGTIAEPLITSQRRFNAEKFEDVEASLARLDSIASTPMLGA
jgi:hypothetical protein